MSHLNQLAPVDPVFKEIASIMKADPDLLKALLEDKQRADAFEKIKASLQKKAVDKKVIDKKIEDDIYFAALDISAIKQDKLFHLFIARKEEILQILEMEAKQLSKALKDQQEICNRIEAAATAQKQQTSPELREAVALLKQAQECDSKLQNLMTESHLLENKLEHFEENHIQAAATEMGQNVAEIFNELGISSEQQKPVVDRMVEQQKLATVDQFRARTQNPAMTDEVVCSRVPLLTTMHLYFAFKSTGMSMKEAMIHANGERGQKLALEFYKEYKNSHAESVNMQDQQFALALQIKATENHLNILNGEVSERTAKLSLDDRSSIYNYSEESTPNLKMK